MADKAPIYKIIALQAENIKRLTAVTIRPDGALVQITGKNGNGKTSILDSIWWAFQGVRNIQIEPIRRGAQKALIKLDLGELVVTRTFTKQDDGTFTTSLKVENADGSRFGSPQAVLDAIVGELAFDPVAFGRMKPDEQFDAVKVLVPGVDFAAIAQANRADFETRTDRNRRAKELRSQAAGIKLPEGKIPKPVDVAALETELTEGADKNLAIERSRNARLRSGEILADMGRDRARLQTEIEAIDARIKEAEKAAIALPALPDPTDLADLQARLARAREGNAVAAEATRKTKLDADALKLEEEAAALTKAMADRETEKAKAIAKAKMPVAALSFGDGIVLLDGVPFSQASDAQQLLASVAIASALNPRLRVIRIRDGSLLDEDAMKALEKMAIASDMQVWVEKVTNGERVGFVLEDGHLVGEAPPPAAEDDEAIG